LAFLGPELAANAPASGSGVGEGGGLPPHTHDPAANIWMNYIETGIQVALAIWTIGAAIFLYRRFAAYFALRGELMAQAKYVGQKGGVRLIETPGTASPLAFGVIDKVIALPPGFLALPDRRARDLALAHEMAHHNGHDLLANVLVQPLFALHWFNPLGHYGWLALRRDQEAACDARVMADNCGDDRAHVRAAYADLIVSYAAGAKTNSTHALTAPMACPVLGEKSIIHRLRSLKMTDTPKSRRLAGRVMIGAALAAMPLTASISYAAAEPESVVRNHAGLDNATPAFPAAPAAPLAPLEPAVPPAPTAPTRLCLPPRPVLLIWPVWPRPMRFWLHFPLPWRLQHRRRSPRHSLCPK
ncbi:MAG: M56 family metallopeptidase, partial [Erythrobacter sp.]|nr:M56 family metallopeptidase [Erythrobacter sp.]